MDKYKNILVKVGIVIAIILFIVVIWLCVNNDSYSDFVVYMHDKLYAKYVESNPIEWVPLGETEETETSLLVENERFSVVSSKSVNGVSVIISDKITGEVYFSDSQILGVDEAGDTVCTFAACGSNLYYNPFTKEFESGIRFVEVCEDKLIIDSLLIQDFFSSDSYSSHMPRFMTVEDFETFSEKSEFELNNAYKLTNSEEMAFEDRVRLFGEDEKGIPGVKMNMFFSDFYLRRTLSVRFKKDHFTPEEKRQCEARFVSKGYAAPMTLVRFTVDISGEELIYNAEIIENISPKNSKVTDIIVKNE